MRHFSAAEWIDFVRQVVRTFRKEKMKEHLEQGCERCSKTVSLWRRVRQKAATEANYVLPGNAVGIVKASFPGLRLTQELEWGENMAELVSGRFLWQKFE